MEKRTSDSRKKAWLTALFLLARRWPSAMGVIKPAVAWLTVWLYPEIGANVAANIARMTGRPMSPKQGRRAGRRVIGHFYEFVRDVGWFRGRSAQEIRTHILQVDGEMRYGAARDAWQKAGRRGVVFVTAHMGSFEAGLSALVRREPKVSVLFKRDASSNFEALRSELRTTLNVQEVAIDDGTPALLALRDALARDEVIVMQADRSFPGQRASAVKVSEGTLRLPAGPVTFARFEGSPIVPVFCWRESPGRFRMEIHDAIEPDDERALEKIGAAIGGMLARYPEQWLVLHKAFEEDGGSSCPPPPS